MLLPKGIQGHRDWERPQPWVSHSDCLPTGSGKTNSTPCLKDPCMKQLLSQPSRVLQNHHQNSPYYLKRDRKGPLSFIPTYIHFWWRGDPFLAKQQICIDEKISILTKERLVCQIMVYPKEPHILESGRSSPFQGWNLELVSDLNYEENQLKKVRFQRKTWRKHMNGKNTLLRWDPPAGHPLHGPSPRWTT